MIDIKIKYDGEYPCLCMGHLEIWVNGSYYDFGKHCLSSGGSCYFDECDNAITSNGKWTIVRYPSEFPSEYKQAVLNKVNQEIPYGCCGGCL